MTVFLTASIMGVTIAVKTDFAGLNEAGAMEKIRRTRVRRMKL